MGRRKTIDEDKILDAAEAVIREGGAAGLTFDAVARRAGVSNGGLQYTYRSKEALIAAMFERWGREYNAIASELYPQPKDTLDSVRRDIVIAFNRQATAQKKAASIIAALLQSPEHLGPVIGWYQNRLDAIDLDSDEGKVMRLAFLATEGAFMLRFFGLCDIGDEEWTDIFQDIEKILLQRVPISR